MQVTDINGKVQRTIGREGKGPAEFSRPTGIAIDKAGNLIVAEEDNNRVQIISAKDGSCLGSIGEGQLKGPWAVCIDSKGRVLVGDESCSVHVFSIAIAGKAC